MCSVYIKSLTWFVQEKVLYEIILLVETLVLIYLSFFESIVLWKITVNFHEFFFLIAGFPDEREANDLDASPIGHLPAENNFGQSEYKRSRIVSDKLSEPANKRTRRSLEDDEEDSDEGKDSDEDPDKVCTFARRLNLWVSLPYCNLGKIKKCF